MNPCGNPTSSRGSSSVRTAARVGTGWPVTMASMPDRMLLHTHPQASVWVPSI